MTSLKAFALASTAATIIATSAHAASFTMERVTFQSGGETVAGHLYIPAGVSAKKPAPGVVVTGAWMTIKEQMAGGYPREMAERSCRTLGDSRG